ncbi:agmatine/peptidylarginine deiminase [Larkinella insperata]|uniref:Agmatine/peptidylarginine deiminase n=1 Tax=Larkinella insperata TaxID=332158 RepID=A0ABW3QNR2_9BACT|nr:agmatine deiminase family protein [Larkinella insperata]
MKRIPFWLFLVAFLAVTLSSCLKDHVDPTGPGADPDAAFYMPAEFEPLASVWLSAPTVDYKNGLSMLAVQAEMIKEILPTTTKVDYAVNSPEDIDALKTALISRGVAQAAIDTAIHFHTVSHGDLWIRDTGGTFMKNKKGGYQVVDFDFDAYRTKEYIPDASYAIYQLDNDVSLGTGAAKGASVLRSTLITEGGNLHFNGKGTVIAVKKSLLASNPSLTLSQIEAELKRVFNLKKVIFLNENTASDSHPVLESPKLFNGQAYFNFGVWHADEMVSWIDDHTVLLPQVPASELASGNPFTQVSYQALEDAYQILSHETNQDGKPLTIIRAPEPSPIVVELNAGDVMYESLKEMKGIQHFPTDGSPVQFVMAAGYMNYVVTNDVVLIPKFYKPGRDASLQQKDEEFNQLIKSLYPTRKVKQLDADAITVGGGGMHCITQQVPAL